MSAGAGLGSSAGAGAGLGSSAGAGAGLGSSAGAGLGSSAGFPHHGAVKPVAGFAVSTAGAGAVSDGAVAAGAAGAAAGAGDCNGAGRAAGCGADGSAGPCWAASGWVFATEFAGDADVIGAPVESNEPVLTGGPPTP